MFNWKKDNYYLIKAFISFTSMFGAFIFALAAAEWGHAIIISGILLIQSFLTFKRRMPVIFFFIFPINVFTFMAGSERALNLYEQIYWYDKVVHFFTEFTLTLLAGLLLRQHYLPELKSKYLLFFIIIVSIGFSLGALWEIIEWGLTFVAPPNFDLTAADTATDLIVDLIGVIAAGIIVLDPFSLNNKANTS